MIDLVGFGELMVRLEAEPHKRFIQATKFNVSYTGAEANVCVSLSRFGKSSKMITVLPDNSIGDAAIFNLRGHGVDCSDIIRNNERLGSYYLERGASQRPSKVIYDRKYSGFSFLRAGDINWREVLTGVRWFHFSGITVALSEELPDICLEACKVANELGVKVSCDLNYRKTLWSTESARLAMTRIMPYVDVVIGNEEDAQLSLGIGSKESVADVAKGEIDREMYSRIADEISRRFNVEKVALTMRQSISASRNIWSAMLYSQGKAYYSRKYDIQIVDRVGGGDSFAGGLITALLSGKDGQEVIEFATAASCLKQTIEQDFNLSTVEEVELLMSGDGSGRVQR